VWDSSCLRVFARLGLGRAETGKAEGMKRLLTEIPWGWKSYSSFCWQEVPRRADVCRMEPCQLRFACIPKIHVYVETLIVNVPGSRCMWVFNLFGRYFGKITPN